MTTPHEDRLWVRLRRPLSVAGLALLVLVAPSWLWFVRGRRLPLHVVLAASQYTAAAGSTITLDALVTPLAENLELTWSGPGVQGDGPHARWRLPLTAGLYTTTLAVRRSGSRAHGSVTVEVLPAVPESYPRDVPPGPTARPPALVHDDCTHVHASGAARLRVHGQACAGANLVIEALNSGPLHSWIGWKTDKTSFMAGPLVNLRVPRLAAGKPAQKAGSVVELRLLDDQQRCVARFEHRIAEQPCLAGPRPRALFADFGWRVIGPSILRLTAKPPRVPLVGELRYAWSFGDGTRTTSSKPTVVHHYHDDQLEHIVVLEVRLGDRHDRVIKAVAGRGGPAAPPQPIAR